ncbi:unnamed protein product [Phytophthora fragariaefolia]|uniref:Unnamed protein product n=1 Tax=Phytophthora fragariaefolia TaxID=1490495 RepID=A0A9W6XRA5_9STRA|nr:unnamed protein product [Phytophthora fragariaefolia]
MTPSRRKTRGAALSKRSEEQEQGEDQEQEQEQKRAGQRVEAFLTSAASRLQEVQTERKRPVAEDVDADVAARQQLLLGPQVALATAPRRCKTATSADGVLQNPLGRHEGRRVWGGGIVKLRKDEWVPWAIDQLVKEEQTDLAETDRGEDGPPFVHRVTSLARGEGLSSIAAVSWGAAVGNVHTAAVPPWMVLTEEEYKKCNRREQAALKPVPGTANGRAEANTTKRRDIFSELESKSEYTPDWLPNFGGVWQEGPRSKTKQTFRKAIGSTKTSRDQAARRVSYRREQRHSLQAANQCEVPPVNTLTLPLPPKQHLVPVVHQEHTLDHVSKAVELPVKPQQEVPQLSPMKPSDTQDNNMVPNRVDAKKQFLLAQKERLRAKMAARRRK